MTEPTRAVARPPIGSENNRPTFSRADIGREVWRLYEEERNRPMHPLTCAILVMVAAASVCPVVYAHTPADPLTIAGDQDD